MTDVMGSGRERVLEEAAGEKNSGWARGDAQLAAGFGVGLQHGDIIEAMGTPTGDQTFSPRQPVLSPPSPSLISPQKSTKPVGHREVQGQMAYPLHPLPHHFRMRLVDVSQAGKIQEMP